MPSQEQTSLALRMQADSQKYIDKIDPLMAKLIDIAGKYDDPGTQITWKMRLENVRMNIKNDTFRIIVAGRFNAGKSTFLNALLGRIEHPALIKQAGPLPTSKYPCTPVLTIIDYAKEPTVSLERKGQKKRRKENPDLVS